MNAKCKDNGCERVPLCVCVCVCVCARMCMAMGALIEETQRNRGSHFGATVQTVCAITSKEFNASWRHQVSMGKA